MPLGKAGKTQQQRETKMLEMKFTGRGGQGVVVASQILGLAFFKAGMYPQCFSVFGGERRGAPVAGFLRVDKKKILVKNEIRRPGELVCFDDSLIDFDEVRNSLADDGRILINSRKPPEDFASLRKYRLAIVDALAVSEAVGLGSIVNTAMLGAYCRISGRIGLDYLLGAVAESVPAKRESNLEAVKLAYEAVIILGETN